MANKARIGDIVEIPTCKGLAYAQFSHYHALKPNNWGALLRVLHGTFARRPGFLAELAAGKEAFCTFFPLQASINRKLVTIVGHEELPVHAQAFPVFRSGVPNPATGKVEVWWPWDGVEECKVGKLTSEQLDLPLLQIPSYPMLVDWIETGWTPRRHEEFVDRARAKMEQSRAEAKAPAAANDVRHYLIFRDRGRAEKTADLLRDLDLQVGVTDLGKDWGVNVVQAEFADDAVARLTARLKDIAAIEGGIYDGTEVAVTCEKVNLAHQP